LLVDSDLGLHRTHLVELALAFPDDLLNQGHIFLEALHFDVLFQHLYQALHDKLLQKSLVLGLVSESVSQSLLDVLLNSLYKLVAEFHFGHATLVDLSAPGDFAIHFDGFLLFKEIAFVLILSLHENFILFIFLLILRLLVYDGQLLILVFTNSVQEHVESLGILV
jgi:hypothetical protein